MDTICRIIVLTQSEALTGQIERVIKDCRFPTRIQQIPEINYQRKIQFENPWDFLLVDWGSREPDEAVAWVNQQEPGHLIILLSEIFSPDWVTQMLNAGVYRCIPAARLELLPACLELGMENIRYLSTLARDRYDLKQAERKERESEARFRAVFEKSPIGIIVVDMTGKPIQFNRAFSRMLGYDDKELLRMHFLETSHPDDLHPHLEYIAEVQAGLRDGFTLEKRYIKKNGDILWGRLNVTIIKGASGEPLYALSMLEDVSERKLAEDKFHNMQEQLERFLNVSPVVIYAADPHPPYSIHFMSENHSKLFGFSKEEFFGDPALWQKRIHPEDSPRVMKTYEESIPDGHFGIDYRFLIKDGTYCCIHDEVNVTFDSEGQPRELVGSFYDITEQRKTDESLRLSEERYRTLAEAARDYIYVLDLQGIVQYANSIVCQALKRSPEQVTGHAFSEFFSPDITGELIAFISRVVDLRQAQYLEHPVPFPDKEIWAGTWMVPIPNENGNMLSILGVSRDITESRLAGEKLQRMLENEKELSELKTRFVTMTSHEFRTPLSTILSSAELLEHYSYKWSDQKKTDHLQKIQDAVKHLTTMLDEVLVIGRADAGKLKVNPEAFEMVEFCKNIVEDMQLGEGRFHPITFLSTPDHIDAYLDGRLLRQTLVNLLSNAIKFSPVGSPILVSLDLVDGQVEVEVSDEGLGITTEDQQRLFEPFYRGKNAAHVPGTGLGLTIVERSLELLCGTIQVNSQEGAGTTIKLRIPPHLPSNEADDLSDLEELSFINEEDKDHNHAEDPGR